MAYLSGTGEKQKAGKKLTKAELDDWYSNLKDSEEFCEAAFIKRAKENLRHYNNENRIGGLGTGPKWLVNANYAYSLARTISTNIINRNPSYVITHARERGSLFAQICGRALDLEMIKIDIKSIGRDIATDAILMGFGKTKVRYHVKVTPDKEKVAEIEKKEKALVEANTFFLTLPPDHPDQAAFTEIRTRIEHEIFILSQEKDKVEEERIEVGRIDPLSFRVPRGSRKGDLPWFSCQYLRTPKQIKEKYGVEITGLAYGDKGVDKEEGDSPGPNPEVDGSSGVPLMVKIHEVWALPTKKIITLLDEVHRENDKADEQPLQMVDDPNELPGFYPTSDLIFNTAVNRYFPQSDIDNVKSQLNVINSVRSDIEEHRGRFAPKAVYDKTGGNEADIQGFVEADKATAMGVTPGPNGLKDFIFFPSMPSIPSEYYQTVNMAINDIYEILGLPDFKRGVSAKTKSATEASLMAQSADSKMADRLDVIEDWLSDVGKKVFWLMNRYYPAEKIVYMVGEEMFAQGAPILPPGIPPERAEMVERQYIEGQKKSFIDKWNRYSLGEIDIFTDLQFDVEAGTSVKPNKENQMARWREVYAEAVRANQVAMSMPPPLGGYELVETTRVFKEILRLNPAIKDVDSFFVKFTPPPVPPPDGVPPGPGSSSGQVGASSPQLTGANVGGQTLN